MQASLDFFQFKTRSKLDLDPPLELLEALFPILGFLCQSASILYDNFGQSLCDNDICWNAGVFLRDKYKLPNTIKLFVQSNLRINLTNLMYSCYPSHRWRIKTSTEQIYVVSFTRKRKIALNIVTFGHVEALKFVEFLVMRARLFQRCYCFLSNLRFARAQCKEFNKYSKCQE